MQLEQEIKSSKTSEEIRKETNRLITQSNEVMNKIKDKHWINSVEYRNAWKEYEDIKNSIIHALKDDKRITEIELNLIKLEFSQLNNISSDWNRSNLDKFSTTAKQLWASTTLLSTLWVNVLGLNAYQEELIEKIIWSKNWYWNWFLHWFSKERWWNYVLKIEDFETDLKSKSVKDINSKALWNYFLYLKSEGKLDTNHLINVFWENTLFELNELWSRTDDTDSLFAKKYLIKNGWKEVLSIISMFSSTEAFLKNADKLDEKQAKIALELLDKNLNSIKEKFKQDLKAKFIKNNPWKEKEADKIINEMIEKLLKHKSLWWLSEIYKIFWEYNEKYKLGLDIQKESWKLNEIKREDLKKQVLEWEQKERELEKKWASKEEIAKQKKKNKEIKKEIRENEVAWKIIQKTWNETISKINSWEIKYEDYINNLVSNNKELQKDFESINYWTNGKDLSLEKKSNITLNSQESQTIKSENTFSFSDGTKMNYSQVSTWWYLIETKVWNVEVSSGELNIIKNNKDALKNMIKFRETLEELNLWWLFKYRESIFKAISNKYTLNFNIKDDYLNKNELLIFIQAILQSIWHKAKNTTNIDSLKSEVMSINRVWLIWWVKDVNVYGDSFIEQKFIQKFDPKRTSILNQNIFEKSLNNLFWDKTV